MNHFEEQRRLEKLVAKANREKLWQDGNKTWAPHRAIIIAKVQGKVYGPFPSYLLDWSIVDQFAIIEKETA